MNDLFASVEALAIGADGAGGDDEDAGRLFAGQEEHFIPGEPAFDRDLCEFVKLRFFEIPKERGSAEGLYAIGLVHGRNDAPDSRSFQVLMKLIEMKTRKIRE